MHRPTDVSLVCNDIPGSRKCHSFQSVYADSDQLRIQEKLLPRYTTDSDSGNAFEYE